MKRAILLFVLVLTIAVVALAQSTNTTIGTFPPPNNGATGFTYQPSSRTYHFTRTDGTFSNVLVFDNSLEVGYPETNDFSADSVNVDGQRDLITYHYNTSLAAYVISSALNLDQDNHFSIGSSSGGGIGSDSSTGDTCIPIDVLANGPCNVPTALHINTAGVISRYKGLTLDSGGNGSSMIARAINGTVTGTVNNYLALTTPASGYGATEYYEVSWSGVVTGAASGAVASATWSFTDESGPNTCSSQQAAFGALGNRLELTCHFYSIPNTPIYVSVITANGSPTYASHLRITIH
jgi:hypothetical protein